MEKGKNTLLLVMITVLAFWLMQCGRPSTYVLFAGNAKDDTAMRNAITLRLPLEGQPQGAMIFCETGQARVLAMRVDNSHVRVRETDGEERMLETPNDGFPVGLVTFWPNGKAEHCGIAPPAPVGTSAYILWGEFTLYMQKVEPNIIKYRAGLEGDSMSLPFPLTPDARATLYKHAVPKEVVDLLP